MTDGSAPIPDRIRVERVGEELLALDAHRGLMHGIAPIDVRAIAAGHADAYEADLAPEVLAAVVEALAAPVDDRRWDRRRVLASGAALAGAGITTVLLPTAAVASSVGFVSAGVAYDNDLTGMTAANLENFITRVGTDHNNVNMEAFGLWEVPGGVSQIQIEAIATTGTRAYNRTPSPYAGAPGRGARAVATVSVTPGSLLVVCFSGDSNWGYAGGGAGGGAVGVGDATAGQWLVVAGGGGGGGNAGININIASPPYRTNATYVAGAGGDAGRGGSASQGGDGTKDGTVTATGGGGGTTTAAGSGGTSSIQNPASGGGTPTGPTTSQSTTRLGVGGRTYNSSDGNVGGNGGCGLYGGGSGAIGGLDQSGSGGGGGSSFIRWDRVVGGTSNFFGHVTRDHSLGPQVSIYY